MNRTRPLVSICCITYNHSKYIGKAIEGFLMQETSFAFEILIGEDDSNDGTRKICEDYAKRFPETINLFKGRREDVKFLFGRPVGQNNLKALLKKATGKYIAICEGDDYWTDKFKLQKQIDYLEKTPNAGGCFHDVVNVNEREELVNENYFTPKQKSYNQFDCLSKLYSSYATCSLVVKAENFERPWPNWFNERTCDEFLDLMATRNNKTIDYFSSEKMGAYRIHKGGLWQGTTGVWQRKDKRFRALLLLKCPEMSDKYEDHLKNRLLSLLRLELKLKEAPLIDRLKSLLQIFVYSDLRKIRTIFMLLLDLGSFFKRAKK